MNRVIACYKWLLFYRNPTNFILSLKPNIVMILIMEFFQVSSESEAMMINLFLLSQIISYDSVAYSHR